LGYPYERGFDLKIAKANWKEGDGVGVGPFTKQVVTRGGRGRVCETDMARVRVGQGMAGQNFCVVDGCLLSLSLCRRDFQDLLKVRPSSTFVDDILKYSFKYAMFKMDKIILKLGMTRTNSYTSLVL
jgi:hypothetical protein